MEAFKTELPERPDFDQEGAGILWHPMAHIFPKRMKTFGKYARKYPRGAVVHYTAGNRKTSLAHGVEMGYCYLLINGDGSLHQAHPIDEWGYHAGKSSYPGLIGSVSDDLIGIEIACAGKCEEKIVNGEKRYKAWFHKNESQYFYAKDVRWCDGVDNIQRGWYQKYTPEQEETLIDLLLWLKHNDPFGVFSFDFVLGHDETSPGRKVDPGASLSMTMPNFRKKLKELEAKLNG